VPGLMTLRGSSAIPRTHRMLYCCNTMFRIRFSEGIDRGDSVRSGQNRTGAAHNEWERPVKIVWKALGGILLTIAVFCIARVVMYGLDSLPFMGAYSAGPKAGGNSSAQAGTVPTGSAAAPAGAPNYSQPQNAVSALSATAPPRAANRPSGIPDPPSIYDRARRAGNRPNQGIDE
jgi:hypothetical protein